MKQTVKQILLILIISAVTGILYNFILPNGLSLTAAPLQLPSGSELTTEQAERLFRQNNTLFIDTRYPEEYEQNHIPGAINIPLNLSRDELTAALNTINKERMIVIYCSSPSCNSSRRLAGYMDFIGFKNIYIYVAGFQEWKNKKKPVEKK
jgi:rhodanese-related sulfurtransferase